MNIQRFTAPTSREALAKARMTFGEGTLILSNRSTAEGIEVIATGEDTLAALDQADAARRNTRAVSTKPAAPMASTTSAASASSAGAAGSEIGGVPVDDATKLAMSTLSFQDYVRERMLRRRQESLRAQTAPATTALSERAADQLESRTDRRFGTIHFAPPTPTPAKTAAPAVHTSHAAPAAPAMVSSSMPAGLVDELQAMKTMIEERFNTLTWLGQARQNPIHSNLMLKLLRSGYSPTLARTILERMPEHLEPSEAMRWIIDVLVRNLRTDAAAPALHEKGGCFALIGATGVGKTTTVAKLAGLCTQAHGPNSVGLITLDTYRVGAHEQLRTYGRMLGVVAHLAHDRAALQDLLGLLSNKKMVLIDTTGIAPNDPRKRDMLDMLDLPEVTRLLVLNAGSHGDTIDDVVASFKSGGSQQTILSKIDEAAKIGPALDACIRHQLLLRGVTTGQKVPQDWERADASKLTALSMRAPNKSAYDPKAAELNFFFSEATPLAAGRFHA
ncbi:flagellar biosynthesis protein FlhF [Candidatus Symbiobacter mobilis]|uniref:Flagellar biosynthesis protein FlhF n=1 Tax=Candidatus Symbiobacter mobilis CR TaxID=946483 RepID=U5NAY9_9BURK|nr:flagellar biosynthesis protein FlhF [Candidatus Symbiobacter mobilis]AGX87393.1 flagellar biosynthesis protein FlhF [Candidatus Symbiobacter mobilis CR]